MYLFLAYFCRKILSFMIDRSTIDRIMEATDIVEVVEDFVSLKKRGVNYFGCCPFHNEKTPSFIVSKAKGIYKCFGCGKAGNAVNFVMEHEQMSYPEALKYLARKYNIEIVEKELTPEQQQQNDDRESMRILNEYAAKYFQNNLLNDPEGIAIGMSYFRERGFTDEAIKTFGLGYSLQKSTAFTDNALKNGYKLDYMQRTGLTIINEETKRKYDRFIGRVMFPIHGISGQVLGFGGRVLDARTKGVNVKYMNSPQSEIYDKSKTLYGIFQARSEIVKQKKCYLVEGYADVISLHMVGVKNVVASSGTSLTEDQIHLIHRLTDDITVLYDGDAAGIHASIRGIDMLLEQGLNIRVVLLPDGEDPDSLAQKYGSAKTIEYLNSHEEDFLSFKTRLLKKEADNDPLKRAAMITDMVKTIAKIEDQIKQSVYLQECSKILEIDQTVLYSELVKYRKKTFIDNPSSASPYTKKEQQPAATAKQTPTLIGKKDLGFLTKEHEIIRLLLTYGNKEISNPLDTENENPQKIKLGVLLVGLLMKDEVKLRNSVNQLIFNDITNMLINGQDIDEKYFINNTDPAVSSVAANACSSSYELSNIWTKNGATYFKEELRLPEIVIDIYNKYMVEILKDDKKNISDEMKELSKSITEQKKQYENMSADEQDAENKALLKAEIEKKEERLNALLTKNSILNTKLNELLLKQGRVTI